MDADAQHLHPFIGGFGFDICALSSQGLEVSERHEGPMVWTMDYA